MGGHKGWRTRKRKGPGKPWVAEAWDPRTQRYASKRFAKAEPAKEWAKDQHARFRARLEGLSGRTVTTDFIAPYAAASRAKRHTAKHVDDAVRRLQRFAKAVPDLGAHHAPAQAQAWYLEICGRAWAPATINSHLRTVRAFVNWLLHEEILRSDPLRRLKPVREPKHMRPQFTIDELRAMAAAQDDPYWLTAALALWQGLRLHEAETLRWSDIDWSGGGLMVRGKGDKDRWVPLQPEFRPLLERERDARAAISSGEKPSDQGRLWPIERHDGWYSTAQCQSLLRFVSPVGAKNFLRKEGLDGRRLDRSLYWPAEPVRTLVERERARLVELGAADLVVRRPSEMRRMDQRPRRQAQHSSRGFAGFLERLAIPKDGRVYHSLRHAYAGMMTATGVPSLLLRAYMGHESEDTSAIYTQMAARYVSAAQAWPMGQIQLIGRD